MVETVFTVITSALQWPFVAAQPGRELTCTDNLSDRTLSSGPPAGLGKLE